MAKQNVAPLRGLRIDAKKHPKNSRNCSFYNKHICTTEKNTLLSDFSFSTLWRIGTRKTIPE